MLEFNCGVCFHALSTAYQVQQVIFLARHRCTSLRARFCMQAHKLPATCPSNFPLGASTLGAYFQGCLDHWSSQGSDSTITGELVVDNLWQLPYEAHCLRDACGSTVFTRTNLSEHCATGLRCGKCLPAVLCCV